MHDLVVRERQHEVLAERVHEAERDLVEVVTAVQRVALEEAQRVVHPAHVPLVAEAQPAVLHRQRDAGPRGRLLGERRDPRHLAVHRRVEALQERDRFEVLAAAVAVGDPLAFLARVVAVEDRRDRVDAQAVDVELAQPVQRRRDQEVRDLVAREVEHVRAPLAVEAFARIGVLVERRAVERAQAVRVGGEVPGNPVEDDADPRGVRGVDERAEIVRRAEAAGRREPARRLIAPAQVERVLRDRQQLDVREAELGDVRDQLLRELARTSGSDRAAPGRASTSRDALRRSRSARRGAASRRARSATPRRSTRTPTARRRSTRCPGASRC